MASPWLTIPLCLVASWLSAQPSQPFTDSVDVQVVEVDVVVTKKGRPVKGLSREDFELYVDGQPVEISNFHESTIYLEERGGRRTKKQRAVVRREAAGEASDAGEAGLTVVLYLDEPNIYPAHRSRLLKRLESAVEPWRSLGARFMFVRFDHRVEVLVPPTRDLDLILEGVKAVPKGSPRAVQNGTAARRNAIRNLIASHENCSASMCRPCQDNWGELLSIARQFADNQATGAAIAADGLADLVTTLSGISGKKSVVHLTDGLPQRPGISVLDYLGNELCRDRRQSAPSETMSEMVQYDESSRFNRLAVHANTNRVTFYGLDAAGLRSAAPDITLDDHTLSPSFQNVSLVAMNAQSGLHVLAQETGGKALTNANDLAILLDDMTGQLAASYSLGFVESAPSNERAKQIKVLLAPGADKGRRIDYRRTYRNKPLEERLAEQLLAVAYLGNERNPLRVHVDTGRTKPLGERTHKLPVAVSVPAESIVRLPGEAGAPDAPGGVRLWLVAVADDKGARTTVRQQMIAVGAGDALVEDHHYRFDVGMNLPEGSYEVAVGVRDETSGVLSLVRGPVLVPTTD